MKLFKIDLDNVGYDTYNGCIVLANSEKEALDTAFDSKVDNHIFKNSDQTVTVTEIKMESVKEPVILLSSFNAG